MGKKEEIYEELGEEIMMDEECSVASYDAVGALEYSKAEYGRVNLPFMSQVSGLSVSELLEALEGKYIWQDPVVYENTLDEEAGWLFEEQYFTGKWSEAMERAKEGHRKFGHFSKNIKALEQRKPEVVPFEQIYAPLGAVWTMDVCGAFVKDLLDLQEAPEIVEVDGEWHINDKVGEDSIKNRYTYGTRETSAMKNIKNILQGNISVSGKSKTEVFDALEKQQQIKNAFEKRVMRSKQMREHLENNYHQLLDYMTPKYNGSFLRLQDLNPEVVLYPYQKDAVARIIVAPNVLLAHSVGAGKTYEMIVGCHEKKRMGLSEKNLVVVPKSVLDATVKMHRYLYPQDKILVITPRNFTPQKREEMLQKIREEDYVAIYMAHSSFDKIKMSKKYYLSQVEYEIQKCKEALQKTMPKSFEEHVRKRALTKLLDKYWKIRMMPKGDGCSCYETLGITTLMVDECHNYKNITMEMRMDSVVGMHTYGSKKADEMLEKVHFTQNQGGSIVFATGTPLTNSLADLFVLQTYLQPEEIKKCKMAKFKQWLNTFAKQETSFEMDVDSQNFRFKVRFTHFHNLPELMAMFGNVCDFYNGTADASCPNFAGYTDVQVEKSEEQKAYIETLVERTENIRAKVVGRSEDNLLLVTMDGRKCALDIRLVMPEIEENGQCKITVCAEKVMELYREYPGTAQIVFCDSSTPKKSFNIYHELKKELLKYEILEEEIAFIHEGTTQAKRRSLLENLNAGKIRVMIGSTPKIGIGVNVQENLIAIHHLDIPWRPSDLVQREGRLIRQGNQNENVFILRYITEGSFDSYTWQIMENKQKFISSFLAGALQPDQRTEPDISEAVLKYSEIKALAVGNPLIKKRLEVANQVEHLRISQNQRKKQLMELETLIQESPQKIQKKKELIETIESDISHYKSQKKVISLEERERFGKEMLRAIGENVMKEEETRIGEYQGFDVILPRNMSQAYPYVVLRREQGGSYSVKMDGDRPLGCSRRLDHLLEQLSKRKEKQEEDHMLYWKNYKEAQADVKVGNPYEKQLEDKLIELSRIDEELEAS